MGTEVLRPHDCLARSRRPLRPAGMMTAAATTARRGNGHGARGDRRASAEAAPRQFRTKVVADAYAGPAPAPRQFRTKVVADAYAGPSFGVMSPSPLALPLPRFSSKAATGAAAAEGVDDSATRELRRLLGLH